jgi:hypothetical protein
VLFRSEDNGDKGIEELKKRLDKMKAEQSNPEGENPGGTNPGGTNPYEEKGGALQVGGNLLGPIESLDNLTTHIQLGGGASEIITRLANYYDIDFEKVYLDEDIKKIDTHRYDELDNTISFSSLKPLYSLYEAKYALILAIWIIDKLLTKGKEVENWVRFEQTALNVVRNVGNIAKLTLNRFRLTPERNDLVIDKNEFKGKGTSLESQYNSFN